MADDRTWRRRFFHGRSCRCGECRSPRHAYMQRYGLVPAPRPAVESAAMRAVRSEIAADAERDDRFWLAVRSWREREREREAAERRRQQDKDLGQLIEEAGIERVRAYADRLGIALEWPPSSEEK